MNFQEFSRIVAEQSIREVLLVVTDTDMEGTCFSQAEFGQLFMVFDKTSVLFEQLVGKEAIGMCECRFTEWLRAKNSAAPDYRYAVVDVFDLFCYRRNCFEKPPTIDQIVTYRFSSGSDEPAGFSLLLSTGASIGIDASSDGGLRYFLDGQQSIFENEYVAPSQLETTLLWKRKP
jgi:hypothetical protein